MLCVSQRIPSILVGSDRVPVATERLAVVALRVTVVWSCVFQLTTSVEEGDGGEAKISTLYRNNTMMVPESWLSDLLCGVIHLGDWAMVKPLTLWISVAIWIDSSLRLLVLMV